MNDIIIIFGGDSDERLVSVASAQAIAETLPNAERWFWHKNGGVYVVDYSTLIAHKDPFKEEFNPDCESTFSNINEALAQSRVKDAIFVLAVHGGLGENGFLQRVLEENKLAFTGSGSISSHIAFDKILTKEFLSESGIKLAPHHGFTVNKDHDLKPAVNAFFAQHGPSVVKPVCGGSSIGCFFIKKEQDIGYVIDHLLKYDSQRFLIEKCIFGHEITVGVIEHEGVCMGLPCTSIVLDKERTFDYDGKYLGRGTKEITPALISPSQMSEAQAIAVRAHTILKLYGYSRTDLILTEEGFYFLEINTLPGLTKQSLVPQQLAYLGLSFLEFLQEQINLALDRQASNLREAF